jgi:hypothetical protein
MYIDYVTELNGKTLINPCTYTISDNLTYQYWAEKCTISISTVGT